MAERHKKNRRAAVALAGMLTALQDLLEGRDRKPPEIVREADDSGAGNDDDPVDVELDPQDPSRSTAVVRPWLRRRS